MMTRAVLVALVSLTLAGAVRAQESADDAKKAASLEEARQHVAKAKVHYDLGEFKEAADEYILVYRLRPIPAILFNVAQAYRQGGMYEKARQFYRSYLRESPDAKNRPMIEQSIREMDELMAKERRTKEAAPTGVKEPAEASLPITAPQPRKTETAHAPPQTVAVAPAPAKPAPVPEAHSTHVAASPIAAAEIKAKPSAGPVVPAAQPTGAKPALALGTPRAETPAALSRPLPGTRTTAAPTQRGHTWTWVAAGATAVALGGGAAFGYKTLNGAAPSDARTANMLYGAGAVLAIATAALFVYDF